ncbi:MAG: methylthioribulose 1-phosphate dehydratase [Bacteroidota bacterium]
MQASLIAQQQELVDCIHFLHQKGYAPATSSNYSFRQAGSDRIQISASGIDKGLFATTDLITIDTEGNPVKDARKPSAETGLHTMLYRLLPEVRCVLHTHTVYNTVLSTILEPQGYLRLDGFEVLKGLSGIRTHDTVVDLPIFANSQDIEHLSTQIEAYWQKHPIGHGFLLAGHGLYTWGESIAVAKRQVEVFEFLFECYYKIHLFKSNNYGHSTHS